MSYKKCTKCDLNYIKVVEDLCEPCKSVNKGTDTIKSRGDILSNHQLEGQIFKTDLSGYGMYLMKRNYGVYTEKGTESTTMSYVRSIVRIAERENMSFNEMMKDIKKLVNDYGLEGSKREIGNIGNGTWRNALNRLEEFKVYIKKYMK